MTSKEKNIKYKNDFNKVKYDSITIMIPKGQKPKWQEIARRQGLSLSAFIQEAVKAYIEQL